MYEYRRYRRERKKLRFAAYVIAFMLLFSLGYYMGGMNKTTVIYHNETKISNLVTYVPYMINDSFENASYASIIIPAVDEEGKGVTTLLTVQAVRGKGRILVNIDKLLFWTDTQNSIRTASKVASNITGVNLSDYDIIYTITTNATAVEGPSAGAALTIATIAALEKKKLDPDVLVTGAINHDGTIGPVGEILPKARIAREVGAKLFLVPLLHSQEITYETRRYCEQIGPAQICTTERIPKKVDISKEAGIDVREVGSIKEALEYFLRD